MARGGLEPPTPRFSVVGRPTRPAMRSLAKRPVFAGISRCHRRQRRAARPAEIPADTRRCRGVWADEWGPSAQTKTGRDGRMTPLAEGGTFALAVASGNAVA